MRISETRSTFSLEGLILFGPHKSPSRILLPRLSPRDIRSILPFPLPRPSMRVSLRAAAAAGLALIASAGVSEAAWGDVPGAIDGLHDLDRLLEHARKDVERAEATPTMPAEDEADRAIFAAAPLDAPERLPAMVETAAASRFPSNIARSHSTAASTDKVVLEGPSPVKQGMSLSDNVVTVSSASVSRTKPLDPHAEGKRYVTPKPLVAAVQAGGLDDLGAGGAGGAKATAERAGLDLEDAAGAGKYIAERAEPTDHLIQEAVAGIKRIEAKDLGAVAPGQTLDPEHMVKVQELLQRAHAHKSPIDGSEDAAEALRKVGAVTEKLAVRVTKLDDAAEKLMSRIFSPEAGTAHGEQQAIVATAEAARLKRESEIASLVRNEVRILTDEMHTELRVLKSSFFSEVRELLLSLRSRLRTEFLRAEEAERKLAAMIGGTIRAKAVDLRDEVMLSPVQEKANAEAAISRSVDSAFNKAHRVAQEVMSRRNKALETAEEADEAREELHRLEPAHGDLRKALQDDAQAQRDADANALEAREDALVAEGKEAHKSALQAADKAESDTERAAKEVRADAKALTEEAEKEAAGRVDQSQKAADERAAENAEESEREAATALKVRKSDVQSDETANAVIRKAEEEADKTLKQLAKDEGEAAKGVEGEAEAEAEEESSEESSEEAEADAEE